MTTPKWLHETRVMKCKVCLKDVPVNINYNIPEVTCIDCYKSIKNDKNV